MQASYREMQDGAPSTDWLPLALTAAPVFSEADPGGDYEATIPCELDTDLRSRLSRGAQVKIEGPMRPWFGRVEDLTADGIHAYGWQTWLDDTLREAVYCDTDLTPWQEVRIASRDTNMALSSDVAGLRCSIASGQAVSGFNRCVRKIPSTTSSRVVFSWTRSDNHVGIYLYRCVPKTPGNDGDPWTNTTIVQLAPAGSGALSGSYDAVVNATHSGLAVHWYVGSSWTPGADFTSVVVPKVYGVAGVTADTPNAVLNDSCDNLPSYVLPAGPEARAFIMADATDMGRLVYDAHSKESDKQVACAAFTGNRLGWSARILGGIQTPVPVYDAHTSTPDYYCIADGVNVIESLAPVPFSSKAEIVRSFYHDDVTGESLYTDVPDSDVTHDCVQAGIERMVAVTADTSSLATATTGAQLELADINRSQAPGQVEINVPIQTGGGTSVDPCDIKYGRILQVDGTREGTVMGRIIHVEKTGLSRAVVTLQGVPFSVRNAIDQLAQGA